MQYLVLESCKAGPGVYLKPAQSVDTEKYPDITPEKWAELANKGLLLAPQAAPEEAPKPKVEPPQPQAKEKGK